MSLEPRRAFLQQAGLSAAAMALSGATVRGAETDRIVVGLIGPGGMGSNHLNLLAKNSDVELAWVCDVDQQRLDKAAAAIESVAGHKPQTSGDLRRVLDDPSVQAVFIATPDHWHAPAAILALDAGKHVYVEKPCCHNIREGRLMLRRRRPQREAACRSARRAAARRRSGGDRQAPLRGDRRESSSPRRGTASVAATIGKTQPTEPPAHLDFDAWIGPAPLVPYRVEPAARRLALVARLRLWRYRQRRRARHRRGPVGPGRRDASQQRRLPGRQVLLRRRSAVPGHAVRGVRIPADGVPAGRRRQLIFEQRIWSPYVRKATRTAPRSTARKGCS